MIKIGIMNDILFTSAVLVFIVVVYILRNKLTAKQNFIFLILAFLVLAVVFTIQLFNHYTITRLIMLVLFLICFLYGIVKKIRMLKEK